MGDAYIKGSQVGRPLQNARRSCPGVAAGTFSIRRSGGSRETESSIVEIEREVLMKGERKGRSGSSPSERR